jgi:RNA polymerase sigma factor FliA
VLLTNNSEVPSREDLILKHLPQVELIARRIQRGLPPCVSLEDLVSVGTVGLISAVDRYNAKRDVQLKTYAEYRIRGAILDSLRSLDWAPRDKRKQAKRIECATEALEKRMFRAPSVDEIATHLNISIEECRSWIAEMKGLTLNSLDAPGCEKDGRDRCRSISGKEDDKPSKLFERAEQSAFLQRNLGTLPNIERRVLTLYFFEEKTLKEIADVVHLHESRVSQLKTHALRRLKETLGAAPSDAALPAHSAVANRLFH